jgi:DNA-binding HxlR family transcriptional regulator
MAQCAVFIMFCPTRISADDHKARSKAHEREKLGTFMKDSHLLETVPARDVFDRNCPTRQVLDGIADKWTLLIIRGLSNGTLRFTQLRRSVDGISPKALTNTLRGMERDGILTRRVCASFPPKVEYTLTDLGQSLCGPVESICDWAEVNIERVQQAREVYDRTPLGSGHLPR